MIHHRKSHLQIPGRSKKKKHEQTALYIVASRKYYLNNAASFPCISSIIKYWFSVSDEEQERRFQGRIHHPTKHWKLSPMDLQSRSKWMEYSKAKDKMFKCTDIKQAPWYVVNGDDKKRARLNVINHLLSFDNRAP